MDFTIDDQYLTSVSIRKEYNCLTGDKEEDLIKVLKGYDKIISHGSEDHPEFTKLRNSLEESGYIKTVRNHWNGDTVLKPFTLNGLRFKKGEKFCCGCAMKGHIEIGIKYQKERDARKQRKA